MQRTQIYLPKSQKEQLKRLARKKKLTVSALIRKLISQGLPRSKPKKEAGKKLPTLLEVADEINKMGPKGPKDLAENHDKYLYGGQ